MSLLGEASDLADKASMREDATLGAAAASIIVSRSAWDAFVSEFVEWRDLDRGIKRLEFDETLNRVAKELRVSNQLSSGADAWGPLRLLNQVRNAIVHYKSQPLGNQDLPGPWLADLIRRGVVYEGNRTWERSVCTAQVARWSCTVVGDAILLLESIPTKRRRSPEAVRLDVSRSLRRQHDPFGGG